VAYGEKRGKGTQPWRVKYKMPNGTEASESGFETKAAALAWGRDQEARIRSGRWTDPNAGKVTVGEWIDRWMAMQDVGLSTIDSRDYMIRRFIRPASDDSALHSLSTEEITDLALPGEIHVEWQLRELNGTFYRIPPKDYSYRSPRWEPSLPVDLPTFLAGIITTQIRDHPHQPCACVSQHGGSGRYVFLGPDGGHYRRSNYARRVFRPACDGRYEAAPGRPARLVITAQTTWPGIPIAAWPAVAAVGTDPDAEYLQPRGRGIAVVPPSTPLACWLPIQPGLTPHGLRHSHKTWMTEDGIPEILAEQRLGHQVPGIRGLYAHASDRMRDELKQALQARWQESLNDRHSPVPLLDQFLAPRRTSRLRLAPGDREKMISQIPPKSARHPTRVADMEGPQGASELVRRQIRSSGANETRTRDPLLAKVVALLT